MDLYLLDHLFLCFFWILGRINNHITEKSVYFEKRPAIILNHYVSKLYSIVKSTSLKVPEFGIKSVYLSGIHTICPHVFMDLLNMASRDQIREFYRMARENFYL